MSLPPAKAETLHPAADYKTLRFREMRDIISAEHPDLEPYTNLLLAHVYSENGALAEDRHGDWIDSNRPCSIGIPQINTCIHYGMNVYRFLDKNPEYKDWRAQFRLYLDWMDKRLTRYGDIDTAIRSWNFNAGTAYLKRVKKNVTVVESFLGPA